MVERQFIYRTEADEPQVLLLVGVVIVDVFCRHLYWIGRTLLACLVVELSLGVDHPLVAVCVLVNDLLSAHPFCLSTLKRLGELLEFNGTDFLKPSVVLVEDIPPVVNPAVDIIVVGESDIAQTVVGDVTAVAGMRLEVGELITVEAFESVPGGKPNHPLTVL